jgi:hypothetical protein
MAQSSGRNITRICRADQPTNNDGNEEVPGGPGAKSAAKGVKIVFSEGEAPKKTLCYFRTDLTNDGVKNSGLLASRVTISTPLPRYVDRSNGPGGPT